MAERFLWVTTPITSSAGQAAPTFQAMLNDTEMDEILSATIYRVIGSVELQNGNVAANRIAAWIAVRGENVDADDEPVFTAGPVVGSDLMWFDGTAFTTAAASFRLTFDIKSRRRIVNREELRIYFDDVAGDYDVQGGWARILLRID